MHVHVTCRIPVKRFICTLYCCTVRTYYGDKSAPRPWGRGPRLAPSSPLTLYQTRLDHTVEAVLDTVHSPHARGKKDIHVETRVEGGDFQRKQGGKGRPFGASE